VLSAWYMNTGLDAGIQCVGFSLHSQINAPRNITSNVINNESSRSKVFWFFIIASIIPSSPVRAVPKLRDSELKMPTPARKRASTPRSKNGCVTCKYVPLLETFGPRYLSRTPKIGLGDSNVAKKSLVAFGAPSLDGIAMDMSTLPSYPLVLPWV